MAIDDERMKKVKGYWYPQEDVGGHEAAFNELWKLKELPLRNRDLAVQAGGNVGVFPIEMAKTFTDVITFEPDPTNYECLVANVADSPWITAYNAGLSDKEGVGGMVGEHGGEYSLVNCGAVQIVEGEGDIPLMTIDSLELPACDLIYLDVEGYEDLALLGARNTIEQFKPVIVCENKGLIPRFPSNMDGSNEFRQFVCDTFGYMVFNRLMRDDIFVCSK